jgi:pimeloyl-ACP methyl ester carboxylesterase
VSRPPARDGACRRLALGALLAALAVLGQGLPAAAAPTIGVSLCGATQVDPSESQPVVGSTPVLFVHGLDSSAQIWAEGKGVPLPVQAADLHGVTAWTFDYSAEAVQWVTDPHIGPALATTIGCLAQETQNKVIVVGHSMGGLATEYAVSQIGSDGASVASHVAKVITIGTPTKGSLSGLIAAAGTFGIETATSVLGGLPGRALVAGIEALHSACAGAVIKDPPADPCSWFGLDETPAGKALMYGSTEIAALPPWPSGLSVVAMAGNIDEGVTVGRLRIGVSLGDVIVSLGSATAYDTTGTPFVATCQNVISQLLSDSDPCYHHNLPHNPQIEAAVIEQIEQVLPATLTQPSVNENSNAAPVTGPDGRLWFTIALQPDNAELGALTPKTGKLQQYLLTYEPSGATLNYEGPIAFDGSGNVWLAAQEQQTSSEPLPPQVLIRFTPATGAMKLFTTPAYCSDYINNVPSLTAASDGSVWLGCGDGSGGSSLYRVTAYGSTTAVKLPAFFSASGPLASGPGGMMYASAIKNGIPGVGEFSATGSGTFTPTPQRSSIGLISVSAVAGNGTGQMIAVATCANDYATTSTCFDAVSSGGTLSQIGEVTNVSQMFQPGMDAHGNLWVVAYLQENEYEDLVEVTPGGKVTQYPLLNSTVESFIPVGAPAITDDGSVWLCSQNFLSALLQWKS